MLSARYQLVIVVIVSAMLGWLLVPAQEGSPFLFLYYLYGLPTVALLTLFGGVHGASRMGWNIADYGGILVTNIALWALVCWVVHLIRARSNRTLETDARENSARRSQ
jgi:hypothetical protein